MDFAQVVLNTVRKVPKGKITTYKLLAKACNKPKASRSVGRALNKNKCSFFENIAKNKMIPCHRVIYSNGRIGGFSKGVEKKIVLLEKEGVLVQNGRVLEFSERLYEFKD